MVGDEWLVGWKCELFILLLILRKHRGQEWLLSCEVRMTDECLDFSVSDFVDKEFVGQPIT